MPSAPLRKRGRPPVKREKSKNCNSTFRPPVLKFLGVLGGGSPSRGMRVLAEREFAKWEKKNGG